MIIFDCLHQHHNNNNYDTLSTVHGGWLPESRCRLPMSLSPGTTYQSPVWSLNKTSPWHWQQQPTGCRWPSRLRFPGTAGQLASVATARLVLVAHLGWDFLGQNIPPIAPLNGPQHLLSQRLLSTLLSPLLHCYTGQLRGWWPCRPQNSYPHLAAVTPSSLLCHLNGLLGRAACNVNICAVLSTASNILTAWYLLCLCKKVNIAKIKPVLKKGLSISIFWQLLRCEVILQFSRMTLCFFYMSSVWVFSLELQFVQWSVNALD